MRLFFSKHKKSILILDLLILFGISFSQNIEKLIEPQCDGRIIKYSNFVNFKEYLENEKNIDGNEIFESLEVFKSKRLGILTGTYYNKTNFNLVTEYDSYDQLIKDLRIHKIDGIIQPDRYVEYIIIS